MSHARVLRGCLIALAGFLACARAHAIDPTEMPTPELQARYEGLTHELRCVQCQDEAISDSPAGIASDLRGEVRDMLLAGRAWQHRHQLPAVLAPLVEDLLGGMGQQRDRGVFPTGRFAHVAELIGRRARLG